MTNHGSFLLLSTLLLPAAEKGILSEHDEGPGAASASAEKVKGDVTCTFPPDSSNYAAPITNNPQKLPS